jgi:hypothetical protein
MRKVLVIGLVCLFNLPAFADDSGMVPLDAFFDLSQVSHLSATDLINVTDSIATVAATGMSTLSNGRVITCMTRFAFNSPTSDVARVFISFNCAAGFGANAGLTQSELATLISGPFSAQVGFVIYPNIPRPH